mmetsp:Transcript_29843/g.75110  ORF Transcript_29843/g.75110 Transcript_29843/m.75110 type:complete len:202 (+) Transcript_29843:1125-1730(+)
MDYNGGSIIIMGGKNCFAIASDLRFGLDNFTKGQKTPKIFKIHEKLFIGMIGLFGDISTIRQILEYKNSIYSLKKSEKIQPFCFSSMLSNLLYHHRFAPFLVETVLAGLDDKNRLFIESKDILGAKSTSSDFATIGSCSESLHGICQVFWKPEMNLEELFKTISSCLILGLNRNCTSGWGGIVHLVSADGVTSKLIQTRMD